VSELPSNEGIYEVLRRALFEFEPHLEISELDTESGRGQYKVGDLGTLWLDGRAKVKDASLKPPGGDALSWPIEPATTAGLRAAVRDGLAFLRRAAPSK
jgi:hypothetical protein